MSKDLKSRAIAAWKAVEAERERKSNKLDDFLTQIGADKSRNIATEPFEFTADGITFRIEDGYGDPISITLKCPRCHQDFTCSPVEDLSAVGYYLLNVQDECYCATHPQEQPMAMSNSSHYPEDFSEEDNLFNAESPIEPTTRLTISMAPLVAQQIKRWADFEEISPEDYAALIIKERIGHSIRHNMPPVRRMID